MVLPKHSIEKQEIEMKNIQEEPAPVSRGAVFIKNPSKRRKCPVCKNNLYLYYFNLEEMFLMCENSSCEFPFGYEPIQIVHDESQLQDNPVKATKDFFEYPVFRPNGVPATPLPLCSMTGTSIRTISSVSCSCLSDCDQLSLMGEADDVSMSKDELLSVRLTKKDRMRRKRQQSDREMENNLKSIKQLTNEMCEIQYEDNSNERVIKNKKWLEQLKVWEGHTGAKLLKDDEKRVLVNSEPKISVEQLNISVDPTETTNTPALNIQIVLNKP